MQAITYHQKPTEAVDYIAPIASGTIDSATWTLIPSHATVDTFVNDDTGAQARVEAGLKYGITYRLVCKVTFVGGVSLDSEVALICDR